MNILSWANTGGGCHRYRVGLPFRELARHGHTTTIPVPDIPIPDIADVTAADVVVCQRLASEPLYAQWRWSRRVSGTPMVYELDDDIWSIDLDNPPLAAYLHPQVGEWAEMFVAESDLVTTSTPVLAERLSRWNRNVVVLPNRLDAAVFDLPRVVPREDGRVTAGWTCSTSHVADLRSVLAPWRDVFGDSRWKMDLRFVGVDYREMLGIGTDAVRVFFTPWREDMLAYYEAIDFDIGLAPLAPIEFNESKSPNKALEYMARGVPVVASDVGPYRDFVEHGVTGFLVREPDEWAKYVGVLADDPQMRAEMGEAGLAVARRHTIQEHWRGWEAAYRSVLR